jgi:hypothetical protein
MEVWSRWRRRSDPGGAEYYRIAPWQRAVVGALYLGLVVSLAVAMSASHIEKDV